MTLNTYEEEQYAVQQIRDGRQKIYDQLSKLIVGQEVVIEQLLISLFAGGNCLITGAPGLAKTLLVRSIAEVFDLNFRRIQFTPDLMPADITGTEILQETAGGARSMQFVKGPIFANVVLADEINRTPPKTQAALLEAMQEHQVTAAGVSYQLEEPFFVLATQNPIEMEGTYPLPEAQLDRFMFQISIGYPTLKEEMEIVRRSSSRCASAIFASSCRMASTPSPLTADMIQTFLPPAASDSWRAWSSASSGPIASALFSANSSFLSARSPP